MINNKEDKRSGLCFAFMYGKNMCEKCKEGKEKHYCGKTLYKMLEKFYLEHESEQYE